MGDSVRQSIMDNLVDRLVLMTTTGGYTENYAVVEEWRLKSLDSSDLPAVIVEDRTEKVTQVVPTIADRVLTITISIVVDETTAPVKLRNYIQDIYKCLGADRTCGGYAEEIYPIGDEIELALEGSVYGVIITTWEIHYQTNAWDVTKSMS